MTPVVEDTFDALADRFADRWVLDMKGDELLMTHRRQAAPSPSRRVGNGHEVMRRLRDGLARCGLQTTDRLLPQRWNRDTDLTISAVQAADPWLKDRLPFVWREGFLPQPVVRLTGERDEQGKLADGYLTSFVNVSHVRRVPSPKAHVELIDHWITALSCVGLYAGRLTIKGALSTWVRPPVAGITLFMECDGLGIGDAVLLWNNHDPSFMVSDIGSGIERLRWCLGYGGWPEAAFGSLAGVHSNDLLDSTRAATLLLMAGIRPAHRGPGSVLRTICRTIPHEVAACGLSRLIRHHIAYWRGFGVVGPTWPQITTQLEAEVLRNHTEPVALKGIEDR